MIKDFGGSGTDRGNTGPFWVGSALAVLSALLTFFLIRPLSHDGMAEEDAKFREYLEQHGYDTSQLGLVGESSSFQDEPLEKDASMSDVKVAV